jgi:hypothetical protein
VSYINEPDSDSGDKLLPKLHSSPFLDLFSQGSQGDVFGWQHLISPARLRHGIHVVLARKHFYPPRIPSINGIPLQWSRYIYGEYTIRPTVDGALHTTQQRLYHHRERLLGMIQLQNARFTFRFSAEVSPSRHVWFVYLLFSAQNSELKLGCDMNGLSSLIFSPLMSRPHCVHKGPTGPNSRP